MTCTNAFSLKSACKDCPFKKGNSYLNRNRVLEIYNYLAKDDLLFPCHKTTQNPERFAYDEAMDEIENQLNELEDLAKYADFKSRLYIDYNVATLEANLLKAMQEKEKICAGWLIIGKKEGVLFNNFRIRIAAMTNQFDPNQLCNEDNIYDSVAQAIDCHI